MHSDEAHRRAEALFKKKQQAHEGREAMVECQAQLDATREKTARLRALRLARDAKDADRPYEGCSVNHSVVPSLTVGRRSSWSVSRKPAYRAAADAIDT